jgi:hypothetical protein
VTRFGRRATIMDGTFQVRTEAAPAECPRVGRQVVAGSYHSHAANAVAEAMHSSR